MKQIIGIAVSLLVALGALYFVGFGGLPGQEKAWQANMLALSLEMNEKIILEDYDKETSKLYQELNGKKKLLAKGVKGYATNGKILVYGTTKGDIVRMNLESGKKFTIHSMGTVQGWGLIVDACNGEYVVFFDGSNINAKGTYDIKAVKLSGKGKVKTLLGDVSSRYIRETQLDGNGFMIALENEKAGKKKVYTFDENCGNKKKIS